MWQFMRCINPHIRMQVRCTAQCINSRGGQVRPLRALPRPQANASSLAPVQAAESLLHTGLSSGEESWSSSAEGSQWPLGDDGIIPFRPRQEVKRVLAPAQARPILILPGFGNSSQDYISPFGKTEGSLVHNLQSRGFTASVLPVERKDWLKVVRALFTLRFWRGELTTDPGYTWYLDRIKEAVSALQEETGAEQVDLIGHSAGGWLGRAFIGDPKYRAAEDVSANSSTDEDDRVIMSTPHPAVKALVTLGTPQRPPPAAEGNLEKTGGAQGWVHKTYPGAHYSAQGLHYVSVAGVAVVGQCLLDDEGKRIRPKDRPRLPKEYAHDSYQEVCGRGQGVEGDAVVPLCSAFLAGARQVVLPGVWHSMSKIGTFEEEPEGVYWYGSDAVVDEWLGPYLETAYNVKTA